MFRNIVPSHYIKQSVLSIIMSKFGETADKILEMLQNEKNTDIEDIRNNFAYSDDVFDFMEEFGLIELEEDCVRITKPGLELLNKSTFL